MMIKMILTKPEAPLLEINLRMKTKQFQARKLKSRFIWEINDTRLFALNPTSSTKILIDTDNFLH